MTGGSSFVVTLPKEWVTDLRIKKNDPVGLIVQPDGTLVVTKKIADEPHQRIKEIDTGHISDPAFLFRTLIGAYITGFTAIRITSKTRFAPFVRTVVRDFTQMTIGQEVIEETETQITVKDLLNPAEMPFDNTLRRMLVIVKTMHADAIAALETRNHALVEDVISRDSDADRLNWLIARQTNMIMQNTGLSRKMGISPDKALYYHLIVRILERIGDHAVRIAENARPVLDADIDKKLMTSLRKASLLSLEIVDRSLASFFSGELRQAHKNIESLSSLESICGDISNMALRQETPVAISVSYIAESIRRTGEYAADISENVINYVIQSESAAKKQ